MKKVSIILVSLFSLLACAPAPEITPRSRSFPDIPEMPKFVWSRHTFRVHFEISDSGSTSESLPQNVSIHYYPEKPVPESIPHRKILNEKPEKQEPQMVPTLKIGCDGTSSAFLPKDIKTDVLEICGAVSFVGKELTIDAKTIILNNVDLQAEITALFVESGSIMMGADHLILIGKNSITGFREEDQRKYQGSPLMIVFSKFLLGEGTLRLNALTDLPPKGTVF